jgi:hypothetical protein
MTQSRCISTMQQAPELVAAVTSAFPPPRQTGDQTMSEPRNINVTDLPTAVQEYVTAHSDREPDEAIRALPTTPRSSTTDKRTQAPKRSRRG